MCGLEHGADDVATDGLDQRPLAGGVGDHRSHARPRRDPRRGELARHAAAPPPAAADAGPDREQRVVGPDVADELGVGMDARIRRVETVEIGQQHEHVGADVVRRQRRQPVVVAVSVVVVGDRVVLVDHRHAAELEQPHEGLAGVQVLLAVDEVVRVEQRLGGDDAVAAELGVPHLHQPALAGRRQRLQRRHVGRPGHQPERRDTGGDRARRDHEHLVARLAHGDDLVAQLGDRAAVDRAVLIRQR